MSSRVARPGREPRFDIDYEYGRQAELQIGELLEWIAQGDGRAEIKRKRLIDVDFYIETECLQQGCYVPSGIATTAAHVWVFCIAETGIAVVIPTEEIRAMLSDPSTRDKASPHGSHPTRGKLINLCVLLYRHKQRAREKH